MLQPRLVAALVVSMVVAAVEVAGGIRAQSLGLVADAVHAGTDALAITVMLVASFGATRPANRRKTFGYGRVEVLASIFNGTLLLGITAGIAYSAFGRLAHPLHPQGQVMAAISAFALCGNVFAGWLLSHSAALNLNARGAFLHVAGDAMGSLAVVVAGALVALTHRAWFDPAFTLVVCAIVVAGVLHMLREALDILLEGVPRGVDVAEVERSIGSVAGVAQVHALHLWVIGANENALSAHVLLREAAGESAMRVLSDVRRIVRERFDVTHVTLQVEADHCGAEGEGRLIPAD